MRKAEIEPKNAEAKPSKSETEAKPVVIEQTHHIETLKAMLESHKIWLEIEDQRSELQKKRLEAIKERIAIMFEISNMIAEKLHPDCDAQVKARLAKSLLTKLLQQNQA